MALHRRISLSDLEASPDTADRHISTQPAHHLPPKYLDYKPGGRDEFFRDLEAYQAAAKIHAQHRTNATATTSPTLSNDDYEAPSYDSLGEVLPTIHETKIFKKRLLDTLRSIRDFTERRRNTPKWSNCFGLSDKVRLALALVLILAMVSGLCAMAVVFRQVAGMLALAVFLVVFLGFSYFMFRKYVYQQRLVEALLIGLGKVERFERIDDKTLWKIKKGIDATLSPYFWMESERRMEEAIPEELRVPEQQRHQQTEVADAVEPPPPAHMPLEHLPPPIHPPVEEPALIHPPVEQPASIHPSVKESTPIDPPVEQPAPTEVPPPRVSEEEAGKRLEAETK